MVDRLVLKRGRRDAFGGRLITVVEEDRKIFVLGCGERLFFFCGVGGFFFLRGREKGGGEEWGRRKAIVGFFSWREAQGWM